MKNKRAGRTSNKNRFITRLDYNESGTHGWWVRFTKGKKVIKSKFFADLRNGSCEQALIAARHWRDCHEPPR